MSNEVSIHKDEFFGKETTVVKFGKGRICVANGNDGPDYQIVWLGDTMKDRAIQIDKTPFPEDTPWNGEVKGQQVCLGFDNPRSIDVLIEALKDAKNNFHSRTNSEEKS